MYFGEVLIEKSIGNILGHTLNVNGKKLSKGRKILKEDVKTSAYEGGFAEKFAKNKK